MKQNKMRKCKEKNELLRIFILSAVIQGNFLFRDPCFYVINRKNF